MDEPSRPGGELPSGSPEREKLGVASCVLDFLKFVVASKTCTNNLMQIFAVATACLVVMIAVVAYLAPSLKDFFVLAATVSGTATISIRITATWQIHRNNQRETDTSTDD